MAGVNVSGKQKKMYPKYSANFRREGAFSKHSLKYDPDYSLKVNSDGQQYAPVPSQTSRFQVQGPKEPCGARKIPHLGKRCDRDELSDDPHAAKRPCPKGSHSTASSERPLTTTPRIKKSSHSSTEHFELQRKSCLGKHQNRELSIQHTIKKPRLNKPSSSATKHTITQSRRKNVHHSYHPRSDHLISKNEKFPDDISWLNNLKSFSEGNLMSLSSKDPDTIVSELHSKIKAFQVALENVRRPILDKPGVMDAITILLSKAASTLGSNTKATQILGEVFSERCVTFQMKLTKYVKDLCQENSHQTCSKLNAKDKIKWISELFHKVLVSLPDSTWSSLPVDEFQSTVKELSEKCTIENRESFQAVLKDIVTLHDNARKQHSKQLKPSEHVDDRWDNSQYKNVQILPQWYEIHTRKKPPLQSNKIHGGYIDWSHYFSVQFHLLREDFIGPLRNGICDYQFNGKRGRRISNIHVYKNVLIKEPFLNQQDGLCYKIKLGFSGKRRRNHKRLLPGSLLCLSPEGDNFNDEVYFAIVRNRDQIGEGFLVVQFQNRVRALSLSGEETAFVMIEPHAYFEASYHILCSIQTAEVNKMPFGNYLVTGNYNIVDQPEYLKESSTEQPYNLSFILTEEGKDILIKKLKAKRDSRALLSPSDQKTTSHKTISKTKCLLIHEPTNFEQWPSYDQTEFDSSQLKSLQMALTQEIAVIQGPPGTGKTYIGLKIVEALLLNKKIWNTYGDKSPILVMCYTNHALDQFLEGIIESPIYKGTKIEDINVIRIGGRSQSEKLAELNLVKKRRKIKLPPRIRKKKCTAEESVREFDDNAVRKYCKTKANRRHVLLRDLCDHDIIHPVHHSQLFLHVISEQQHHLALEDWLGFFADPVMRETYLHEIQMSNTLNNANMKPKSVEELQQVRDESNKDEDEDTASEATIEQSDQILDDEVDEYPSNVATAIPDSVYEEYRLSLYKRSQHKSAEEADEFGMQFDTDWVMKVLEVGFSVTAISEEESSRIQNIHGLSLRDRWRLYHFWCSQYLKHLCKKCEQKFENYNDLCKRQKEARKKADRFVLERAEIIGMTTTGAAKHQHILREVKPRIVIVEEAAEVLESHIVSALNAGTQHLILIGDHKQLRPKVNEYELVTKYQLDISLFERLVSNGFPHATLEYQHRMRPEIAELIKPHIYKNLSNHESVQAYPNVRGISTNLFFINHNYEENKDDNLISHSNAHEASYLVSLCRYLLQQCYKPEEITILVMYTGQLLAMRNVMFESENDEFKGVRVCTVDNYQGEENTIILLSLVRSNSKESVGFLKEENRVCVALSRAREGFYCIGNFTMLQEKQEQIPVWNDIISDMKSKGKLGDSLLLHCNSHPETSFSAKTPKDFIKNSPNGGCNKICKYRLPCGHACVQKCHFTDPKHADYHCEKPCAKKCPEGHPCQKQCYETCHCMVVVTRQMPVCNHDQLMHCYKHLDEVTCTHPCKERCPKGHPCPRKCHKDMPCGDCVVPVVKTIPVCSHKVSLPCHVQPDSNRCTQQVTVELPACGHQVEVLCNKTQNLSSIFCTKKCQKSLACGHPCDLKCGDPCNIQCKSKVSKVWPCGHTLERPCYQTLVPEDYPCREKCKKKLECGHSCSNVCSEPCDEICKLYCSHILACGHKCDGKCSQCSARLMHKPCGFKVEMKRFCSHTIQVPCNGLEDSHDPRAIHLICSHSISKITCMQDMRYTCDKPCEWNCAHYKCNKTCSEVCTRPRCNKRCKQRLKCGHQCYGLCGEPCLSICPKCEQERFTKKLRSAGPFKEDDLYYQLMCKDIFTVKYLDQYVRRISNPKEGSDLLVSPLQCPHCCYPFRGSCRYGNQAKQLLSYVQDVNMILKSTPLSSGVSNCGINSSILLRDRVRKFTYSKTHIDRAWSSLFTVTGKCVEYEDYELMPEISVTLYELKKLLPIRKEEKYLVLMFTEALNIFEYVHFECSLLTNEHNFSIKESTLNDIKEFLRFVSKLIMDTKFQLSYQIVIDVRNVLLRLYLRVYHFLVQTSAVNCSRSAMNKMAKVQLYLKMLTSSQFLVAKNDFLIHMDAMSEFIPRETFLDYKKMLREVDAFWPDVHKGQWWRCKEGHYYCSPPSILEGIEFQCPKCKGKSDYTYHLH